MKLFPLLSLCVLQLLIGCHSLPARQSPGPDGDQVTISPGFIDTYRWHPYHLTKASPDSPDGVFRLVGVSKEGDAELIYLSLGEHITMKRDIENREVMASKMPMKITKSDFVSQSVDFEWLTTN
jgi:hypothetical protein